MNEISVRLGGTAKFLCLLVILTNLSQMPYFVNESMTKLISMPVWALFALYCIVSGKKPNLKCVRHSIVLFIFFVFFLVVCSIGNQDYFHTSLGNCIYIPLFVMIIGTCLGPSLDDKELEIVFTCFIWSVVILCYSVYTQYIAGQTLGRQYLYGSKNSISNIILSGWTFVLFFKLQYTDKIKKFIYLFIFLFFTFILAALQSRASLLCMPIALLFAVSAGCVSKGTKKYLLLLSFAFVAYLLFNRSFTQLFIENIVFAGRDITDLDDLSSNRASEWANFGQNFIRAPLLGVPGFKQESIIIASILEFGLIGGIPLLLLALQPLIFCIKEYRFRKTNLIFVSLLIIASNSSINGIFEQQAPFGPGVKCYILWLLFGIVASKKIHNKFRKLKNS